MADAIKYNVSDDWSFLETPLTRLEVLDLYNSKRQGEGLPKIYTLKLMSVCEDINIEKVKNE